MWTDERARKGAIRTMALLALPAAPDLLTLPMRWQTRIDVVDPGYWMWTGQVSNQGYGLTHWRGQKRGAHVAVFETLVRPIPAGFELDHLCRIPLCVFPLCLEIVTPEENRRRWVEAMTHCRRFGHEYTPENTYRSPRGERRCRECMRIDERARPRRPRRGVAA